MSNIGNSSYKKIKSFKQNKQWNRKDWWDNISDKWPNSARVPECI